jgi:hypothetical protein
MFFSLARAFLWQDAGHWLRGTRAPGSIPNMARGFCGVLSRNLKLMAAEKRHNSGNKLD